MAKNTLTPEQDLLTRQFFVEVAEKAEELIPDATASARSLRAICLQLLNYNQLQNGAFVEKGKDIAVPFGSNDFSAYPDEWAADEERAREALNNTDTIEASPSEPAEDTAVRETVLSEDVS